MTFKRTISLFGIIVLVTVIGFLTVTCGDGGGDKGDPTFLGEELTLSGQVYKVKRGGTPQKPSINYEKYTGSLAIDNTFITKYGGSGEIKNGQFYYTLGTPTGLVPLSSKIAIFFLVDEDYDNVTYSNSTAKGISLPMFLVSGSGSSDYKGLAKFNVSVSGNSFTWEYVYFVYVDKDVTISGKGKTTDDEDGEFITKDFKIALKAGWNAIHWKTTGSSEKSTETISLGNPSLKWVLIEDYDD